MTSIFSSPVVSAGDVVDSEYVVVIPPQYESDKGQGFISKQWIIDLDLRNGSKLFFHLIPVQYGHLDLDINSPRGNSAFSFKLNTSEGRVKTLVAGFTNLQKLSSEKPLFGFNKVHHHASINQFVLSFDSDALNYHNVTDVIISGYSSVLFTGANYTYLTNANGARTCRETGCDLVLNITNNLDLPVTQIDDVVVNFNNRHELVNASACMFTNISSNFPDEKEGDITMRGVSCEDDYCNLEIYDFSRRKVLFECDLLIEDDSPVLRFTTLKFYEPLSVNLKIDIKC